MELTWREAAQGFLFIIGMLALFYVAMISSSAELVMRPIMRVESSSPS